MRTCVILAGLALSAPVQAGGPSGRSSSHSSSSHSASHVRSSTKAVGVARDSNGRIARSSSAKESFMRSTGHPNGWPGHVVDHVVALKRRGSDTPSNMQWQDTASAKAKDKWE